MALSSAPGLAVSWVLSVAEPWVVDFLGVSST